MGDCSTSTPLQHLSEHFYDSGKGPSRPFLLEHREPEVFHREQTYDNFAAAWHESQSGLQNGSAALKVQLGEGQQVHMGSLSNYASEDKWQQSFNQVWQEQEEAQASKDLFVTQTEDIEIAEREYWDSVYAKPDWTWNMFSSSSLLPTQDSTVILSNARKRLEMLQAHLS